MQDIILQENKCTTFLIWSLSLRSPFYFCLSDLKVTRGITSKISNELMIDKHREVQNWETDLISFRQHQEALAWWKVSMLAKGVSVLQHHISVFLKTNLSFVY